MNFKNRFSGVVIAAIVHIASFTLFAQPVSADYKDSELAQLFVIGYADHDMQQMKADSASNIGGIILFRHNVQNREQLEQDIAALKQVNPSLLVAVDQEGGRIQRLRRTNGFIDAELPSARAMALFPIETVREMYDRQVSALTSVGINVNLAPVVDLDVNHQSIISRDGRSFGTLDDVVRLAREALLAHQKHGVLTALKHFPGHGSASGDTHEGFTDVTKEWSRKELEPFQLLIKQMPGAIPMVMTSHLYNARLDNQYPATLSKVTVQMLNKDLGYRGAIISDDLSMSALSRYPLEKRLKKALLAGHHLLIYSNQHDELVTASELVAIVRKLLKAGDIPPAVIADALEQVKRLKAQVSRGSI